MSEKEKKEDKKESEDHSIRKWFYVLLGIAIIVIIGFIILGIKIKFALSDELDISLTPKDVFFETANDMPIKVNFTIKNNNFPRCRSICQFTLTDLRNNTIISYENKTLGHDQELLKEFTLVPPIKEIGQNLYIYRAECKNIRTVLCPSSEEVRSKTSLITLSYNLSKSDEIQKNIAKQKIESAFNNSYMAKLLIAQDEIMILEITSLEAEDLQEGISNAKISINETDDYLLNIFELWKYSKFDELNANFTSTLENSFENNKITAINIQGGILRANINRNRNIGEFAELIEKFNKADIIVGYYLGHKTQHNIEILNRLDTIARKLLEVHKNLAGESKLSQNEISQNMDNEKNNLNKISADYQSMNKQGLYFVLLSNAQQNIRENHLDYDYDPLVYSCDELSSINEKIGESNEAAMVNALPYSKDMSVKEDIGTSNRNLLYDSLNEILKSLDENDKDNKAIIALFEDDKKSIPDTFEYKSNLTKEGLYALVSIDNSKNNAFIGQNCGSNVSADLINLSNIDELKNINTSALNNITIDIPNITIENPYKIPELAPMCCTMGECKKCCDINDASCKNNEMQYPILFIHGHSFNEENTPEYSMSAFTKLQKKLENDGYINAGELDIEEEPEEILAGQWLVTGQPYTIRASYYYINHFSLGKYSISAQKSERIENYALRLKEIIDLVKLKSGSDKVNIVAHSMGGLVTREYLSLFGDNDVNKIILIGTPHKGVLGKVQKYCSVLGSQKECDDMAKDSIFLSRLNSKKLPENNDIYAIRANGCKMDDDKEGDGIVTDESGYLDGAKNYVIKGRCTDALQTNLHSTILDPDLYPQTYDLINEILDKNATVIS